jgi:uncharacterized protein YndB with AHSA1/START domain
MAHEFTVADIIPATPQAIYEAWLSSIGHSAMTGSPAEATDQLGGTFTAWDGYIQGINLELTPYSRIVQSWRTLEFAEADPDSKIEVTLEPVAEGTRLTLHHTNIPDGQNGYYEGWKENYFEPMKAYFAQA